MTHLLVVDDSAVDRRLIGGLLEDQSEWTIAFAADGTEALRQIEQAVPDVLVTDLDMPGMDGLGLLQAVHMRHPEVPVVLVTAFGSEALAVEALRRGAASYVPKSQLADRLPSAVAEVAALARADQTALQVLGCLTATSFVLHSDPELVDPLVEFIQQMVVRRGFGSFAERLQIGVALREALVNALYHGSLEISFEQLQQSREALVLGRESLVQQRQSEPPYCHRKIYVDARVAPDEVRIVVRDEGPGFDVATVPQPGDPKALEPERGRGLSLMRNLMEEVFYNEAGNEVMLVKRPARTSGGAEAAGAAPDADGGV